MNEAIYQSMNGAESINNNAIGFVLSRSALDRFCDELTFCMMEHIAH